MAEKSTNTHTVEVGSITLYELYRSLQDQLRQTMKRSLDVGNQSLAGRLDDVLIRQRFWEYDIHMKDGALSDLEATDTVASSIIRRYLNEIARSLSEMNINWDDDTNNEGMSLISDINTSMCGNVEIFDAIAAIEDVDATGNNRKSTAIGQLRRQLELENQRLHSQSGKELQGTLRLLYSPEKLQKQSALEYVLSVVKVDRVQSILAKMTSVVAVHSFNSVHKAAEQHALDTWRKPASGNGRFWLRDDLPEVTPQAHIFLYQYDSINAFETKTSFVSAANDLLESISSVRQEDPRKPLLFIAHSVGGWLVLRALMSAISSVIYKSIYRSTLGIALFNTPNVPFDQRLSSASRIGSDFNILSRALSLPKDIMDMICNTNVFADLAELRQSEFLSKVHTVSFISPELEINQQSWPSEFFGNLKDVNLNAAPSELCRFDWSEDDQANLDIVRSEIGKLYDKVLEKAESKLPMSQMTHDLDPSDSPLGAEKSFKVEKFGSSSSAKTQTTKAAGSEKPSGHNPGPISSTKTHNPKASVSRSPYEELHFDPGYSPSDEELEFHPPNTGKSAR